MDNLFTDGPHEFNFDFTKESYEYFPFIVTCIYGTLLNVTAGLCACINLTFHSICSFIFKSFKLVYLMFQMFESILAFSRSLLQFNYILVSRGLTVLGQVASKSLVLFQLSLASLHNALISSHRYVQNIPYLCYQKIVHVFTSMQEFSLAVSEKIINNSAEGYLNFITHVSKIIRLCCQHALDIISASGNELNNLAASSFSQFVHILHVLHKQATSFTEQAVNFLLVPIFQAASFVLNSALMLLEVMGQFFASSGQSFIALISETTRHINAFFEHLVEWITMPFTLGNLSAMLESILLVLTSIINIVIFTISLTFGLLKSCLAVILELLASTFNLLMSLKKLLTFASFWSIIAMLTCLAAFTLMKNIHVLHKMLTLLKNAGNFFLTLGQQINFNQHAPERIEEEREEEMEEMLPRNDDHENLSRNDEKQLVVEPKREFMTSPQYTVKEDDDLTICIVCQDEQRSTVLLPCRHLSLCRNCAESLKNNFDKRKRICPLCREHIQDIMDVYI